MTHKTTLLILFLALFSGQALAHHDNGYRGQTYPGQSSRHYGQKPIWKGRYNQSRNHSYGRNQYGYSHGKKRVNRHRGKSNINYHHLLQVRPEEFARWYADTAASQAEEARYSGCRFDRAKGRWTTNWNKHYRHGLKSRRETSFREVEIRDRELRQCHRYSYNGW
jgi:hypothetical protein